MGRELQHVSHEHTLILKAEEIKIDDGADHSPKTITCAGCPAPISGPFYSCRECDYVLHKVCAELPNEMNHPMHPQHPLILHTKTPDIYPCCVCNMCKKHCNLFVYHCSTCKFDVDMICASASHPIEDKCHPHPLTPIQHLIPLPCCHICQTQEKAYSYKCNICPFWVHQNCTVSLPSTVKYSDHNHLLTLLDSIPSEFFSFSFHCDICHINLPSFHCVYYCAQCMFFAHVCCARSGKAPQSSRSRDQNIQIIQDLQPDDQSLALLPVLQQSTDLISWFAENYRDQDPITNLILGFAESYIDPDTGKKQEIKFFDHSHPLFLIDDQVSEEICDACAQAISPPSYGCVECGYFLHRFCAGLPTQIHHPAHPQHQIGLSSGDGLFRCSYCFQLSNGFGYVCSQCEDLWIDVKCASLVRPVKHAGHRHPLIPRFTSSGTCNACNDPQILDCHLKCDTCSFYLCFECAMMPATMKHRYDQHPFVLTYSPPENHYNEYICDLCEGELIPKFWHYHCSLCDQFEHLHCLRRCGADSNIKYGKSYKSEVHEHELTLVRCTNDSSYCHRCHYVLRFGYSVGFECKPCNFKIHVLCPC